MSVQYLSTFDPMLEFNFILERCFGQPANIPNSVIISLTCQSNRKTHLEDLSMKKVTIDNNSLAHTSWNCKYHIEFAPKYR